MRKILLLRGVNVGGTGKLPMAGFRQMLTGLGLGDVQTYIQSGNAVFDDPGLPDLTEAIAGGLKAGFRLSPALFFYPAPAFDAIIAQSPFAEAGAADGAKVFVYFLDRPAMIDMTALQTLATSERLHLTDQALHLHAPDGVGRSVLAEKLPRFLKVTHTARNWNTVRRLSQMVNR